MPVKLLMLDPLTSGTCVAVLRQIQRAGHLPAGVGDVHNQVAAVEVERAVKVVYAGRAEVRGVDGQRHAGVDVVVVVLALPSKSSVATAIVVFAVTVAAASCSSSPAPVYVPPAYVVCPASPIGRRRSRPTSAVAPSRWS